MFKNIPLERIVVYFVCIGVLPLVFIVLLFFSQNYRIDELRDSLDVIRDNVLIKEKKQALNLAVRQHFRESDHFYVDKYLETLVFLEPETEALQKIVQDKNFANDERVKKRIEFLTGDANAFTFSEGVVQSFPFFQETAETLIHPVEVNAKDIQKILSKIEGVKIGDFSSGPHRPQLFITEFKLDKKKVADNNEVFLLNLKLIKREFL